MARYYKKYRTGGRSVPGMYKAQNGDETAMNPVPPQMQSMNQRPMIQASGDSTVVPRDTTNDLTTQNAMIDLQMQEAAMRQQELARVMQQMQMQNMLLQQQNELQKTQINKMDLINSARTTKKQVGSVSSPKRRGGAVKAKRGKEKRIEIMSSSGGMMKRGGGLPGGRFSKRR
jgi:DNA-binding protein H-NS